MPKGVFKCRNIEDFIEIANRVHNNFYNYNMTNYDRKGKVKITCPIHGLFFQDMSSHLRGTRCPKCCKNSKLDTKEFIKKASIVHKNKYDYSLSVYVKNNIKLDIICPTHGVFNQLPSAHLFGQGCSMCAGNQKGNTSMFILNSQKIHGHKYDYKDVIYGTNNRETVVIICKKHGPFVQTPHGHLRGYGCPVCANCGGISEKKLLHKITEHFPFIEIVPQGKPKWLKTRKTSTQSLDIYIKEYNIAIEYQGIQHFKPQKFFGGEIGFIEILERDNRKLEMCKNNNCVLLYFTYDNSYIPVDYHECVYSDEQELIERLEYLINNK